MTSHRAAVALLGTQGGDVLVVVRTGQSGHLLQPENSLQSENISVSPALLVPTESQQEDSEGSDVLSDQTGLSLGKMKHSRRHCPQ